MICQYCKRELSDSFDYYASVDDGVVCSKGCYINYQLRKNRRKMKRSKICGLLLVLFTIFGLFLNVSSNDVNALKYSYSSLTLTPVLDYFEDTYHSDPQSYPYYPYSSVFNWYNSASSTGFDASGGIIPYDRYGIWYSPDLVTVQSIPDFHAPRVDIFDSAQGSSCVVTRNEFYDRLPGSAVGFVSMYTSPLYSASTTNALNYLNQYSPNSTWRCREFGQASWIEYSSIYMHSSYTRSVNTVSSGNVIISSSQDSDTMITTNTYLSFSELSGYDSGRFYGMILPLTYKPDNIGDLTQGREVSFEADFQFTKPITLNTTDQRAFLYMRGLDENNIVRFQRVDCGMLYRTVEAIDAYDLITTCDFTAQYNYKAVDFVETGSH